MSSTELSIFGLLHITLFLFHQNQSFLEFQTFLQSSCRLTSTLGNMDEEEPPLLVEADHTGLRPADNAKEMPQVKVPITIITGIKSPKRSYRHC